MKAPLLSRLFGRSLALLALVALVGFAAPSQTQAAPSRGIHQLDWKVHVDLIDAGAGLDLAYYTALIQARLAESNTFLQGHQGPVDNGCCVELDPVTVTTFGSAADGLNVIQNATELSAVFANPGNYLVESVWFCAGTFSMSIAGCAQSPGDRLVVGFEIEANQRIPATTAHERGHNAGLNHVSSNPCELMSAGNGGGCLSVSECNAFIADADVTSGTCECLADTLGDAPVALGTSCTPDLGGSGFCGGGVCGEAGGSVETLLFAAGGVGAASGIAPTSFLEQTPASGDWSNQGALGGTVTGLAYDRDADVLYGIESLAGDDALVIVDATTGAISSTVGVLTGIEDGTALAFDADSVGGDRLYLIEVDDDFFGSTCMVAVGIAGPCFSAIFEVDPSDASTSFIGEINNAILTGGATALTWHETNALLYFATPAGLRSVDPGACSGGTCSSTMLDNRFYTSVALAWEPNSGDLIRVGFNGVSGSEIEYYDLGSGESRFVRGIDQFTAGGLAAGEAPTTSPIVPALGLFGSVALFGTLLSCGIRRANRSPRR